MLTATASLFFTACNQQNSAESVLENEEQRQEIMEAIAEDHELMMEMHQVMMNSEHGKMMMLGDEGKMREMMLENPEMMPGMMQNMMDRTEGDSTMRNNMTGMITMHSGMMKSMMKQMHQKGMMSDECMQNSMQKMDEMGMSNGMMKGERELNGMNGTRDTDKSHDDHH